MVTSQRGDVFHRVVRTIVSDKQPIGTSSHAHPLKFAIVGIDEYLSMRSSVAVGIA